MFPPQTSLIPVTVALGRFAEEFINREGWPAIRSLGEVWYPYWYLGVPFRYLTGPIVPLILFIVRKVLPNVSLFDISIYLLGISLIIGAFGWGVLAGKISAKDGSASGEQKFGIGHLTFVILLILPWRYFSSLVLSEASEVIAKNFLPYALIAFIVYLKNKDRKHLCYAVLSLSALLLISTSVMPILLVGLASLILAVSFRKGKLRKITIYIKPALITLVLSLIMATLWYTPGYWLTVVLNPSIGGAIGYKVFLRIIDLLRALVPLALAFVAVSFSRRIKNRLSIFSLTWLFTFLFLTLFRFIGDPDFWQDWTSWVFELETGIALIVALPLVEGLRKVVGEKTDAVYSSKIYIAVFVALITPFLITKFIYSTIGKPSFISKKPPETVESLSVLASLAKGNRVFLSGSTVFWANALYDLTQVRGGVDKAARHPFWDHAAFQLREGENPELALAWLQTLGVEYVLVHGTASPEAYHDFRNLEKWNSVGQEIWQGGGDVIYKIPATSLAWEVNSEKVKSAKKPEDGKDLAALKYYLSARKFPVQVHPIKEGYEIVSEQSMKAIQISINFDNSWKAVTKEGKKLEIQKDSFGNILVFPQKEKEMLLKK